MKIHVSLSVDHGEYFSEVHALRMEKSDIPLKGDILTLSELGESWEVVRREMITHRMDVSSIRLIVVKTEYR